MATLWPLEAGSELSPRPSSLTADVDSRGLSDLVISQNSEGIIKGWLQSVTRIQKEQPHWVTPLVTVTPRLEQEVRYDQFWQAGTNGSATSSFGGGKGLEFIPFDNTEIILGVPAWQTHNTPHTTNGWGDESLLVKYRIASKNEEHGDYILSVFLGTTLASGDQFNTIHHSTITPTVAFGKGWGDFDIQTTLGVTVPDDGAPSNGPGTPILWNTAFQYRLLNFISPEIELNDTYWSDGVNEGRDQLFITPGVVFGRFPIADRFGATVGVGCQLAVTESPAYDRNIIITVRFPF